MLGEQIVLRNGGKDEQVMRRSEIPLVGEHNLENVLAAVTATRLAGAKPAAIAQGVKSFAGVEHRLEFVAEMGGVRYYNDSKATNVDATLKALDAFPGRVLIILGGKDKGSDYRPLQQPLHQKATLALLIGAAGEKIEKQSPAAWQLNAPEHSITRWNSPHARRGPAMWCCWPRRAQVSISSRITSIAAGFSSSW